MANVSAPMRSNEPLYHGCRAGETARGSLQTVAPTTLLA